MNHRIITHGGCMDGYCSAFLFKKYYAPLQGIKIDEVIGVQPRDVQIDAFELLKGDVVLDLPCPKKEVFLWIDHHTSNRPEQLKPWQQWKQTPSCSGFIIELLKKKNVTLPENIEEFKEAIDKVDSADYTPEDIKECYYPQGNYDNPSMLQKVHITASMIHTKDYILNTEILNTIMNVSLGELPVEGEELWNMKPLTFFKALLKNYEEWRNNVDTYVRYDEASQCVVQDDRKSAFSRGSTDRYYVYMKFPDASYSTVIKAIDETHVILGIGSNIFHKERCKVDIGALCKTVGRKYGEGSGGGHYAVGGATVFAEQADEAVGFILKALK